ncbi:MAG: YifB family Mg chelatase-like AAA ATPase [Treponema sp.]
MDILSFSSFGYEGEIIRVEADLRSGLPVIDIVGLPGSAVKEAKERMKVAIKNSKIEFPQSRILINLSPADLRKDGSSFDLPIALSVLVARLNRGANVLNEVKIMVMGELELSGNVRPVRGVLGAVATGVQHGIKYFVVPKENEKEASILKNVSVFGVSTLKEAFTTVDNIEIEYYKKKATEELEDIKDKEKMYSNDVEVIWTHEKRNIQRDSGFDEESFGDIKGQNHLVRALEIAAAGGHNLLAYGPPGCGKTLSLRRFQSLLPDMDFKTSHEVTRIYSVAGLLGENSSEKDVLIRRPPFRMPHPNASLEGMIGGAGSCLPGEISLAHGGVLFLDEATQFKTTVLQTLRSPLETGRITVSRAGRSSTFPANFQLLVACNPCPCGNFGADGKVCTCMPQVVENYWKKLTAPLLDRIDLRIPVFPPSASTLLQETTYSIEDLRKSIKKAREVQWERSNKKTKKEIPSFIEYKNANLLPRDTSRICDLTGEASMSFSELTKQKQLSGRGSHAVLKIARTIADIESKDKIATAHLEEAFCLRQWSNFLPDFLS